MLGDRAAIGDGPADEWLWEAVAATALETFEFVAQDGGRMDLAPGGGAYHTTRAAPVLVDGRILPDVPARPPARSRIEVVQSWWSNRLGNARDFAIYLPRGYDSSTRRTGATPCSTCTTARTCSAKAGRSAAGRSTRPPTRSSTKVSSRS